MFGINEKGVGGWVTPISPNIMGLIGMLGPRKCADSPLVLFSVFSRLGDTLAEALVLQNKNDSSRGPLLSRSLCREHQRAGVEF